MSVFESSAVMVDTSWTEVWNYLFDGTAAVIVFAMEVENHASGGAALTGFKVQLRAHENGQLYDYLADADFGDAAALDTFYESDTVYTLASGSTAMIVFRVPYCYEMVVLAKSGTEGNVQVRGTITAGAAW